MEPFFTEEDFPIDIEGYPEQSNALKQLITASANAQVAPLLEGNRLFREFLINVNKRVMPGVTDTIDEAVNRVRDTLKENERLKDALKRVCIQVTPEEYEEECGSKLDGDTVLEAYEAMILEARAALGKE